MSWTTAIAALVAAVCLPWLAAPWVAWRTLRAVRRLADEPPPPADAPRPRVSVVVPARNEAEHLADAARSHLAADDPALELLLVDDRSDDGTGAIVDALAAEDPRVVPLHVDALPDGWLGKAHAMQRATERATGDWLLYTDADVHVEPDAVRRAVAHAERRGLDFLAAFPEVSSRGPLVDLAFAGFGRAFVLGTRLWQVEDPDSDAFVGIGAFNLVRRAALERTEGLPWLRLEVADDLALGKLMKDAGARCAAASAVGLVRLTWYTSLREMAVGLEKNSFVLLGASLAKVAFVSVALLALEAAPFVAVAWAATPWLAGVGVAALLGGLVAGVALARWSRRPLWAALLGALGSAVYVGILVRAAVLGTVRGGVTWRGTFHSLDELRRSMRVRFQ